MAISEIQLKKLTLSDLTELKNISQKTYSEAFSWGNSKENMISYLNSAFSNKQLKSEINEEQSVFYFAKIDYATVGYIKINFGSAQTDLKDDEAMELERIYVLEKFQGKKIGKKLLNYVIEIAKKRGMKYLWLGVWEKNEKAINFYKSQGFTTFNSHSFKMGNEIQNDLLMKLVLQKNPPDNNS